MLIADTMNVDWMYDDVYWRHDNCLSKTQQMLTDDTTNVYGRCIICSMKTTNVYWRCKCLLKTR